MMNCCAKRMPTSVGKGPSGNAKKQITKEGAKLMSRSAGSVSYTEVKKASPYTSTISNWRAKNREDPRVAEMAKLFGGSFSMF